MHNWGDKDFDWKGLDEAIHIITSTCRTWGRIGGQAKEKYGTARFYANFGGLSLHTLVYPGYAYNQFPKWLWNLDCKYIGPILSYLFDKTFRWWQTKVYNIAYQRALKAYPHLRAELLVDADYLEYINGATRKEGNTTYVLGWTGETIATWECS